MKRPHARISHWANRFEVYVPVIVLAVFAFLFNQHYGNQGIYPIDSEGHFDTAYRILNGQRPFHDYFVVVGPLVDYLQAMFFYVFGVSWQVYVAHASFVNAMIAVSSYAVFNAYGLSRWASFFYAMLVAVLAYPPAGTPYVDHHAALISLLGVYCLLMAIKTNERVYWFVWPMAMGSAFLSKQVPTVYIAFAMIATMLTYAIKQPNRQWIRYALYGGLLFASLVVALAWWQGIAWSAFYRQYIAYPIEMGAPRMHQINWGLSATMLNYKFMILSGMAFLTVAGRRLMQTPSVRKGCMLYATILLTLTLLAYMYTQMMTRNYIYIYFYAIVLCAFAHGLIDKKPMKSNQLIMAFLVLFSILVTVKYHARYNEHRKFRGLQYVNLHQSADAEAIHPMLRGLKWATSLSAITRKPSIQPVDEINRVNVIRHTIMSDPRKKMIITNYAFLPATMGLISFSPARWYIGNHTDVPPMTSSYYQDYRQLFTRTVKTHQVKTIYVVKPHLLMDPIAKSEWSKAGCFERSQISNDLIRYDRKSCPLLN